MNALPAPTLVVPLCLALAAPSRAPGGERAGAASLEVVPADEDLRTPISDSSFPFFACGDSICDATSQYCEKWVWMTTTRSRCVDHPPSPGSAVVSCACLEPHGGECADVDGGATLTLRVLPAAGEVVSTDGGPPRIPLPCGSSICDAATQYCSKLNGIIATYSCVDHAPCPGSTVVSCACLDGPFAKCTDLCAGAMLTWGGG